ncbi:MAG: riboflavin synthase [Firmicutes bacterium]|nr:riboflavin synthase [Bacillota bacterium]
MFTGIIEEVGIVKTLLVKREVARLSVAAREVLLDVRLGDSIAVNGVCLTVIAFLPHEFTVDVMPETFNKTNLRQLTAGDPVNLERALTLGGRLGGHLVSGHVDGVGRIIEKRNEGNAVVFHFTASSDVLQFIIAKGSVAIDGISLTVADVRDDSFSVSVIPHTTAITTLGKKKVGGSVNLENDLIGKYVARLLTGQQATKDKENISLTMLRENGF